MCNTSKPLHQSPHSGFHILHLIPHVDNYHYLKVLSNQLHNWRVWVQERRHVHPLYEWKDRNDTSEFSMSSLTTDFKSTITWPLAIFAISDVGILLSEGGILNVWIDESGGLMKCDIERWWIDWLIVEARLAQSVERQALNLVVEGSSPSVGDFFILFGYSHQQTFGFGAFRITQKGHIRTILIWHLLGNNGEGFYPIILFLQLLIQMPTTHSISLTIPVCS